MFERKINLSVNNEFPKRFSLLRWMEQQTDTPRCSGMIDRVKKRERTGRERERKKERKRERERERKQTTSAPRLVGR